LKASDFAKQGLNTVQEVLNTIPMNQSSQGSSQSVGAGTGGRAVADLRGIGGNKTLVLLNGRRLANHPYFADTIDLNVIPISALDRVEVLRDGASAIYGSDAIGGVINFITKKSVKGASVMFEGSQPIHFGGGDDQRFNVAGGYGDLATNGWSAWGVADWNQQTALTALDRSFADTGIRPEHGVSRTSGTTFPANFFSDNGITGNPFFPGCLPPSSVPSATNRTCRYDYTRDVDLIPQTAQLTVLLRGNYKFGFDAVGGLEYLHSRSTNQSRVAPPPMSNIGITMFADSPFYPGNGVTPAVPGLAGSPLDISWRPTASGKRVEDDASMTDRVAATLEGVAWNWDYNSGLVYSQGRANSTFTGGYLIDQNIIDGVGAGILNPFGDQTPAGQTFLTNSALRGQFLNAKITSWDLEAHASRNDLYEMGGGGLGVAFGAEYRHDKAEYIVNTPLASQASSSGFADAQNQFGSRNIWAVFGEVNMPFTKTLEVNLAARYDWYTQIGGQFNPKISLRWQPNKQWLGRASANKGFRAPTLYDLFGPQTVTFTSDQYDDPKLCPGGVPQPGTNPNIVCNQQQNIQQGGNPNVGPEKSTTWSIGGVWEPTPTFTASADWWNIKLKNQINSLPEQTIFGDPAKFADLFHYNPAGNQLLFVSAITTNLGELKTRGLDVSALWRLPRNQFGAFSLNFDGTYVNQFEFQNEPGGPFIQNAGRYANATPVFRWRSNLSLNWTITDWIINLVNRYQSHYIDQNDVAPGFEHKVSHYSTWTLSGTYTANKRIAYTVGVKNLFDQGPPYSNQGTTFQQGYDPRYTDPIGAQIYMRLVYNFL
jgi:iron complex outermembrane receptor protein